MFTDLNDVQEESTKVSQIQQLKEELFNTSLDFSSLNAEKINQYVRKIVELNTATLDAIATLNPENLSFAKVMQPMIDLEIVTQNAEVMCTFPMDVYPDKAVREASENAIETLTKLSVSNFHREDVFNVFKQYEAHYFLIEKDTLHFEQIKCVEDRVKSYKHDGMYITEQSVKDRIKLLDDKIIELSTKFNSNVNEENSSFVFSLEELNGLPQSWFTDERKISENQYKVTLKYPDVYPIMKYATNRLIRETIYLAFETRCEDENLSILKEILQIRSELAKLKGYNTHADYSMEERMAKTPENVKNFLDDMNARFTPLLTKNLYEITEFAKEKEGDKDFELQLFDIPYYMRMREDEICDLNSEEITKYFPIQKVISGTLEVYSQLLGLNFVQNHSLSIWHEDVTCFDVFDKNTNEKLGAFYLDLYPREGKYSHAAAYPFNYGCDTSHLTKGNTRLLNIAAMVCNFPQNENLAFADVVTFFHEFGHVMHFICSQTKLPQYHSNSAAIDFIEAPSQMLENWCFEPVVLNYLSSHIDTNEPLPAEIANKMKFKDQIHAGYVNKRQLVYGYFDFLIHNMQPDEINSLDLKMYFQNICMNLIPLPVSDKICTPASFGHTVAGYDAGYYGYMMSQTYSADMFASVFKQNPLCYESGMHYRRCILQPGASLDANEMLQNFLGRSPDLNAFLDEFGLSVNEDKQKSTEEKKDSSEYSQSSHNFFQQQQDINASLKTDPYEYYTMGC